VLPAEAPRRWQDQLAARPVEAAVAPDGLVLAVGEVLAPFPVGLLVGG
jgi:hypothetical protein